MADTVTYPNSPSGEALLTLEWLLVAIISFIILARLYLRLCINRQKLFLSDVFVCLAWCSVIVALSFHAILFHLDVLRKDLDFFLKGFKGDKRTLQRARKYIWMFYMPFYTSLYLSKAALLAFYRQVIPEAFQTSRRLLYTIVVYCAFAYTTSILLTVFICFPIERRWTLGPNTCSTQTRTNFQTTWALNFFADLIIFILPFTFLHVLNIRGAVRVGVYCTFGLGIVNIAICLTRFLSIQLASSKAKVIQSNTTITLWSSLDMCIGLIIANLPSLAPYLRLARTRPSGPVPRTFHNEPVRKDTLDKYKFWRYDEESGTTPLQSSERSDEGGKKTLTSSFEDAGIIPAASSSAVRDIEMDGVGDALGGSK